MTLLAAAALLLVGGALAAGSDLLRLPSVVPPVPSPSLVAVATASPDATTPSPSPTPTVRPSLGPPPSDPPGPLVWTQASVEEDWPAPVREEPAGGASVLPILRLHLNPGAPSDEQDDFVSDEYRDPTDDTGSDVHPWADIRWVRFCREDGLSIEMVSESPPMDPRELWIASGVVEDRDRDGVPDWRYGIEDVPVSKGGNKAGVSSRWWRTDLHTGRTDWAVGDHFTLGERGPVFHGGVGCGMTFDGDSPRDKHVEGGLPGRFYAWTSVIMNGRVVATDYAPDVGWLDRSPDAKPLPKPGGTYEIQKTEDFPLQLSMTVPDGWTGPGGYPEMSGSDGPEFTRDWETTRLHFSVLDNPEDPCPDDRTPLGPSFDDLVSYLEAMPNIDFLEMRYGTLDGYRAVYLKEKPVSGHFDCMASSPISLESTWIVDVGGVRLVIEATNNPINYGPGYRGIELESAPAATIRSEVRRIVESIRIVGPER